jgi:P-type E1-E2 ATPase
LLARSLIKTGSGKAIVCAVGKYTRWSKFHPIEELQEEVKTYQQKRLEKLAEYIGKWAKLAGVVIFVFMLLFIFLKIMFNSNDSLLSNDTLQILIRAFTTSIAIVIVAVPEGLPLAVSISMAFSSEAMRKDQLLVKQNKACEELAFINNICTGKTSTLTTGEMHVEQFHTTGTFLTRY